MWLETASAVSVTPWGFAAPTAIAGDITGADCSKPQTTPNAVLAPRFDIANARGVNVSGTAQIQLRDGDGKLVLENSTKFSVPAGGYNDFDIRLTHLSSLASTNAVASVPCRVVYITLLDVLRLLPSC